MIYNDILSPKIKVSKNPVFSNNVKAVMVRQINHIYRERIELKVIPGQQLFLVKSEVFSGLYIAYD